jgi:hypothetical protein
VRTQGPELYDGGTVAVWLVEPNFVFTRVRSSTYTVTQAETFVGPIWSRARTELAAERYVWVSDSRAIASYDIGSRLLLTRWSLDHQHALDRIILLVSPRHRLVSAGARVGCLASSTIGIPAFVESSPDALRDRHGIAFPGGL